MSKLLCSRFFLIFQNTPLKYSRLYVRLQIILKRLYRKVIHQIFFERRDIFEILVTSRYGQKIWNKHVCKNPQQMAKN